MGQPFHRSQGERDPRPHAQTDEGIEGIGIATSYTPIEAAIHAFRSGIAELVIGADPLAPERLYRKLFALTWQRLAHEKGWSREALVRISAAVDIACWDILGKVAKLPLYRLFGGFRSEVPCYVTCAYYRDGKDAVRAARRNADAERRRGTPASRPKPAACRLRRTSSAWRSFAT